MTLFSVEGLHASYGRIPILNGISLSVAEGEAIGILGHNGMGKTTLLKTLMGFVPATEGRVTHDGTEITRAPPHARSARGIGYVPQGREIFPALSVLDNLRMGCVAKPVSESEAIERVLGEFPRLKPLLDRTGGALSGGEQQLLAIARCLCGNPTLVLLDEPTEGIQPSIITEIAEQLAVLQQQRGLTIILVEQNLEFISRLSQRVLIIQKGAIIRELDPEHVNDPDMVAEFVGMAG